MDEDTRRILTQWSLEEYVDVFKENKIDVQTLNILDEDMIKELIKPIGDRAKFSANLKIWKQISLDDSTHSPLFLKSSLSTSSVQSAFQSPQRTDYDFVDEKSPLADVTNNETPASANTSTQQLQESEYNLISILEEPTNKDSPSNSNTSTVYFSIQQQQSLRDILKKSAEGKTLLKLHENEGILTNNGRRKICNLIVQQLLLEDPNVRVSHETLFSYAKEIKEIFPGENISTYYVPYINNNKLKIKTCAKGKLYDCLHNRRREYRQADKKREILQADQAKLPNDLQNQQDNNEDIEQDILWLQNSMEPWQMIEEKWRKTAALRLKDLYSSNKTIAQYMTEFPALTKATGYSLLLEDFNTLYPEKEFTLHEKFSLYKKKIINQAIQKASRDASLKLIIQQLSRFSEDPNEIRKTEAKNIIAFMVLPILLGNPLAKVKKGNWRPSKQESCEGFITHVTTAAEVQATISSRREKFSRLNVTLQPFIIIVGHQDYTTIEKYYVVVNDTFYVLHSIVDAVDVCFKIFHSLNCRYPIECLSTWQFIQKGFYDIETSYDKQFISVNAFMTDLGFNI